MLNLKKTAVAVLALGSSAVSAGTMGSVCIPRFVTVPCENTAWEIDGYALYLEPVHTGPFSSLGTIGSIANTLVAGWDWGFALGGAYHYSIGNDIRVTWNHVNFGADQFIAVDTIRHYETNWDALHAEFGQKIDLSAVSTIRLHGGVQYTRVNSSINRGIELTGFNSDYNGFGPRMGADMNYFFGTGFSVYGKSSAGLLVGTSSFSDLIALNPLSNSNTTVVPEFDAKIGINYDYALAQGELVFDAGYMWVDYFNIHQNTVNSMYNVARGSWALSGPYAGLKLIGEV